ncbi:pqn-83, partial [Pristionchus pacificus]
SRMDKRVLLLVVLISTPVIPRRSSSGGGGGGSSNFNRGSSGARGNPSSGQNFGGQSNFNQGGGQPFRPQTGPSGNFGGQPNNFNRPNQSPVGRPNTIGGNGGIRQNAPAGGFAGGNNNFRPTNNFGGPSSFQQSGVGSRASSGSWKTALAAGALGAVGGVVAWEAGKAIIRSAEQPFNHGGRNYYFDNNGNKQLNGQQLCSMPLSELQKIESPATTTTTTTTAAPSATGDLTTTTVAPTPENVLQTIQYPSGDRPKMVTWGCKAGLEVCCGTDCCPAPQMTNQVNQGSRPSATGAGSTIGTVAVLIVIFCLLLCCCGCFIVYKCFGGMCDREDKRNDYDQGQGEYPMQQYGQQPNYSQPQYDQHQGGGYPPQNQYPNQGYPPQPQQYPNQYNPNQAYPAYPHNPQY